MDLDDENELFDTIIITDAGISDSDDKTEEIENSNKPNKFVRTTKEQFKKILSYMETHNDFVQGKASKAQTLEWDAFIVELNGIGPPYRTSDEWRIVWANYKGNRKRRIMSKIQSTSRAPLRVTSTLEIVSNAKSIEYGCDAQDKRKKKSMSEIPSTARTPLTVTTTLETVSNVKPIEYGCDNQDKGKIKSMSQKPSIVETGIVDLDQAPNSNHKRMKLSNNDEDKENFHSNVLNKLDTLIEQQKLSNKNIIDLINVIQQKFLD